MEAFAEGIKHPEKHASEFPDKGAIEVELLHTESLRAAELAQDFKISGHIDVDEPHARKFGMLKTIRIIDAQEDLARKFEDSPRLADVTTGRVSEAAANEVLAQAGVAIGDSISLETAKQILLAARKLDEHLHVEFDKDDKGGLVIRIEAR
jgi:hypothetical protein